MKCSIYIAVFLPSLCWAQSTLKVSVSDPEGNPLPNQVIQVSNASIGLTFDLITDGKGIAKKNNLSSAGSYSVFLPSTEVHTSMSSQSLILIGNQTSQVFFQRVLLDEELLEVTVSAQSRLSINRTNAAVSSTLPEKTLSALPVEGRDITRALYRLPNITQATGFFPEAPTVSINGANSLYTSYLIDGLDNNENFLGGQRFNMPIGFTQSISALTNNFSAKYGLSANGVINVTTKSGTNTTTGEVFYVVRPGALLDASSAYAQRDLSGNPVQDGFQRHQVGFGLGGAIKKNKTFYYLNIEQTIDTKDNLLRSSDLGVNETVRGNNSFTYLSGKLDHHWNDNIHSSLRTNIGLSTIDRQGGGLEGGVTFPSAGTTQHRNSLNVALKNTWQMGNDWSMEANYLVGRFLWDYGRPKDLNSPRVTLLNPNRVTIAELGAPAGLFVSEEWTQQLQWHLRKQWKTHHFEAGIQYRASQFSLTSGGNPNGSYLVELTNPQIQSIRDLGKGAGLGIQDISGIDPSQVINYSVELRPQDFENTQRIWSAFLEDEWDIDDRWNASLGIRVDQDNLSRGASTGNSPIQVAPRLSLNYNPSEKFGLRGGFGMYYDKILYAVRSDAQNQSSNAPDFHTQLSILQEQGILPQDANFQGMTHEGNVSATLANVAYLGGPNATALQGTEDATFRNELRITNPNGYNTPVSYQFMLGTQVQVSEHTQFYADLMYNRTRNLFRLRNLNAAAPYDLDPNNVVPRSAEEADLTRPVPIYRDSVTGEQFTIYQGDTITGVARNVIVSEAEGASNYYALNLTYEKQRGDDNYAFRVLYTLSYLENNTEDINFRAMDGNRFENEWGRSINDRRHLINAFYQYFPNDRFSIGLAMLLQSGQPINRTPDAQEFGTADLNGDGAFFSDAYTGNSDRYPGEDRNSDELPWSNTFDLNLQYLFPLKTGKIEASLQVFNLFNATNLSGFSNPASQSNQVQAGSAESGVIVRRNAAPPRQFQCTVRYIF